MPSYDIQYSKTVDSIDLFGPQGPFATPEGITLGTPAGELTKKMGRGRLIGNPTDSLYMRQYPGITFEIRNDRVNYIKVHK